MDITFDKSFLRSIKKIKDKKIKNSILLFINEAKLASNLSEINNIKKIVGYKTYYRYRIKSYRLGFELISPKEIRLIIFEKRNDIYKKFP